MKATLVRVAAVLALLALAGTASLAAYVALGLYDVAATTDHYRPVHALLDVTMRQGVRARAAGVTPPADLADPRRLERGAACFRDHCVQCHGAPGVARGELGKGLQPVPDSLIEAARRWRPREVYWITRHGLKMTGMPAWEFRLAEADLWAVTAFVDALAGLSPDDYAARMAAVRGEQCSAGVPPGGSTPPPAPRGTAEQGRTALRQYACAACHVIPGVAGSDVNVGPSLEGLARRPTLVGGRLVNTPEGLMRWIRAPHAVDPATAMPDLGVTEEHARQMVEYLQTLR